MSNAFDKASLVMLPHAYEEGKVYSLKPTDRSGDFTFSRGADTATRVGEDGYIKKEHSNLLLQSNNFNTTWTTSNASVTSGQSGYDGSNDAWLLTKIAGGGRINQAVTSSGVQTLSFYAKANTLNWLRFITIGGTSMNTFFDLQNGAIGTTNAIDTQIESVGSGWYRCSIALNQSITEVRIYPADADGDTSSTSGSIYIQDAQLEQGMVARDYIETTTAPVYGGLTDNMPRLDYTDATCPSLLLEPSRTNLMTKSEYLEGWHSNANVSFSTNEATSPEGLTNATKLTATSTSNSYVRDNRTTSAGNNVFSVFAKYEDCQYIRLTSRFFIGGDEAIVWFDIQNGVKGGSTGDNVTYDIEDYGNGWYRCYFVFNVDAGDTNGYCYVYLSDADESLNVVNGTSALFYGGQLEVGSYPTSYIPTYGYAQTRPQDDSSSTNRIDADNDFTFYFECDKTPDDAGQYIDFSGNLGYLSSYANSRIRWRYESSNLSAPVSEGTFKFLIRKDSTDIKMYVNGELKYTKAVPSGLQPFDLKQGAVHKILLFPTALSDDECIALTTL